MDYLQNIYINESLKDRAFYPTADDQNSELALIVCYFNWVGYKRSASNLLRFLRQIDKLNITAYGVELYLENAAPIMEKNRRWECIKATNRNIMWQKEALLNKAEKMVPKHIKYIGVFDPDIYFENKNWLNESLDELKKFKVIQPFSEGIKMNEMGGIEIVKPSAAKYGYNNDDTKYNTPGLAWIFNREFFDKVGLYPYAIIGSGDSVLAAALLKIQNSKTAFRSVGHKNWKKDLPQEWLKKINNFMGDSSVGYIEGQVWHEWHGDVINRRYETRRKIMKYINISEDIFFNKDSILEWSPHVDNGVPSAFLKYFESRLEDGTFENLKLIDLLVKIH
jgi:hypothetical protein